MQRNRRRMVETGMLCIAFLGLCSQPIPSSAQSTSSPSNQGRVGCILATHENRVSVGEGDTVIIDQGKANGVQAGDRFVILDDIQAPLHPATKRRVRAPRQVIGEVAVVHVHERASTAVVITNHREIGVGAVIVRVTPL